MPTILIAIVFAVLSLTPAKAEVVSHPAGCPSRAFCGCGAALYVFGQHRRDLWLAANWYQFPRTSPGARMAAVWRHHVMIILEAHGDGTATVYDANSGGRKTRVHRRSIANATIVDPSSGGRAVAGGERRTKMARHSPAATKLTQVASYDRTAPQ